MSQIVAILGRQPALGLAELESFFGADKIRPLESGSALLDVGPADFPLKRIGGTMKAGRFLAELPFTDWSQLEDYLASELPRLASEIYEGKIRLGLSVYGLNVNPRRLNATGLTLKKAIKAGGHSVRVVPNNAVELNTAQVTHNQLTGPTGFEILLVRNGNSTIVAQTFAVQDIDAYAARDQKRPKRDARVGMLPPKLAQIIVNLAKPAPGATLLDPFCGTGVVLQEALLSGLNAYGTDLEPRMIEYSEANLEWLGQMQDLKGTFKLEVGDATEHQWSQFDTVACETYLGRPFTGIPTPPVLTKVMQDVDTIHVKFLKNLSKHIRPGARFCIAVPAWRTRSGFAHLKMLDSLEKIGYTRVSFAHVSDEDLLYHRADQIVARELVVLKRK